MKKRSTEFLTYLLKPILIYAVGALVCHFLSAWFSLNLAQIVIYQKWQYATVPASVQMWTRILLIYPISFGVSLITIWTLLQKLIPTFYFTTEDNKTYKYIAMAVILPGELVRYIVCLSSMGSLLGSGRFSVISSNWFNQLWWALASKSEFLLSQGKSSLIGGLIFTLCYIAYLLLYLFIVLKMFRYLWKVSQWEAEDLGSQTPNKIKRNF